MKWQAKATSSLKTAKWHPLVPFSPHMTHKAAKSTAKIISQSCGESQSASACQGMMGSFEGHLSNRGHQRGL